MRIALARMGPRLFLIALALSLAAAVWAYPGAGSLRFIMTDCDDVPHAYAVVQFKLYHIGDATPTRVWTQTADANGVINVGFNAPALCNDRLELTISREYSQDPALREFTRECSRMEDWGQMIELECADELIQEYGPCIWHLRYSS